MIIYKRGGFLKKALNNGGNASTPLSVEDYKQQLKNNYQSYIDSGKVIPYTELTKNKMNCIRGVCGFIEESTAKKFKELYTGNPTFNDNRNQEGFYKVDPLENGYQIGDIVQWAKRKGKVGSRFPGEVTSKNENELWPTHGKVIVDTYEKDGKTYYNLLDNGGEEKFRITPYTEEELNKVIGQRHDRFSNYNGLIVNRYNPQKAKEIMDYNEQQRRILSGDNEFADQYGDNVNNFNVNINNPKYRDLVEIYRKNFNRIGKGSNLPPEVLNKLIERQIGIAEQESKFGKTDDEFLRGTVKNNVPTWGLNTARWGRDVLTKNEDWIQDIWDKNGDYVRYTYPNQEAFRESIKDRNPNARENTYNSPRSKGIWQQKEQSKRGKFLDLNLDNLEGQALSSLALAIDNYHQGKGSFPNLDKDKLVDVTTLMHSSPVKASTKEFVNHYIKNNDADYVNKVNKVLEVDRESKNATIDPINQINPADSTRVATQPRLFTNKSVGQNLSSLLRKGRKINKEKSVAKLKFSIS